MNQPASYNDSTGDCIICGAPIFKHSRSVHDECRETAEQFWRKVCERAEREGYVSSGVGRFMANHHKAATEIIAEMRRASE